MKELKARLKVNAFKSGINLWTNPRYKYGNYRNKNGNINNEDIKNDFSPISNFYRRFPTPNNFRASNTTFINKMMFNSLNNN